MKDLREDDPERLYKMFMKENGVSVEFSPDGLDWSDPITADAAGGSIRVTAIDAEGNKLATSQTITDDVTDQAVIFPDGFKLTGRGNSLRLRFEIRSARLYSFSITFAPLVLRSCV
jgi:hypothetical protein